MRRRLGSNANARPFLDADARTGPHPCAHGHTGPDAHTGCRARDRDPGSVTYTGADSHPAAS